MFFTQNLALKLIALAIGFFIWLFVTNNNDPVRTMLITNVPITLVNEESIADIGKVVEPEGSGTVTLRISERKSVLSRLNKTGTDFSVVADLENITELNTVPLTVSCTYASITWDEIDMSPSSLKVTLEDKVEQGFSVSVTSSGTAQSGYAVGTTDVEEGKTILIAGPASLIRIIDKVQATINITGLYADTTLTSTLKIYDKNGSEFTESQLSLLEFKTTEGTELTDRTVTVDVSMWHVQSDIRLDVQTSGSPADGYTVGTVSTIPETVSLAGTQEALDALGGVLTVQDTVDVTDASDTVEAEIDLTDTLEAMDELKLLADADPVVQVSVDIEKSGDITVDIPLSAIATQNAPEDMKLVFTPADKITVVIHAEDDSAETLHAEDITAAIDLSECISEGTYEIPVDITLPEGYELSSQIVLKVSATPRTSDEAVGEEQTEE